MTDAENPRHFDADTGATPPVVPEGGGYPTTPPASTPYGPPPLPGQAPVYGPQPHPQQAPMGYQPYGQPGFGPIARSNGKATAAMILGIIGLALLPCYGIPTIFLSPTAFFMGRSSQKEIDASPGTWSNAGMAKAGWIMGLIGSIIVLLFILVIAVVLWVASVDDSNF